MTLGVLALWAAVVCCVQVVLAPKTRLAWVTIWLSPVFLSLASARLALAFVSQDWSSEYVADHARSEVGPLLRMSGSWAGPEGSLLLWTCLVSWSALVAARMAASGPADTGRQNRASDVRRIGALVTGAYAIVVVFFASPFTRLDVPAVNGLGLAPILEYPAMLWHPPLLYLGLVALLPSAFLAVGGSESTVRDHQQALLGVPLAVLCLGLISGSRWAHAEVGWGGYWAWDPIETAGLVAWLTGAAVLHGLPTLQSRAFVLPGVAAVWATTLTRIGVIDSVHAFADRPGLRIALLVVAAASTILFLGSRSVPRSFNFAPGRSKAVAVLGAAAFLAAVGTYEPLVEAATTGNRLAIAGTYFSKLLWPVALVGVALAVGADKRWLPAAFGAGLGLLVAPAGAGFAGLGLSAAGASLVATAIVMIPRQRPGALAHLGAGVLLIGIGGTVATTRTSFVLSNDESVEVAGFTITHSELLDSTSNGVHRVDAIVSVNGSQRRPGLARFVTRGATTSEVANFSSGLDEAQLLLLDGDAEQARYRLNVLPRLRLVWIGSILLAAGVVLPRLNVPDSYGFLRLRASN